MIYAQFLDSFHRVLEAFDSRKFPPVVLERIHTKVDDLNPMQMRELCNLIIDRCEHAPRTAKVIEFANLVRARDRQGLDRPSEEIRENCDFCHDLGIIRAVATDRTHETLMRCECSDDSDRSNRAFPKWTREWAPLFEKHRCPLSWFKPEILTYHKDGTMKMENINKKVEYWTAKVKIAEAYWKHQKETAANDNA